MCTFVLNWLIARQRKWEIVFRIEDIDGPRKKDYAVSGSIDILKWVGLDWDGEVLMQTDRIASHQRILETLQKKDLVYHCALSRTELEHVLSAPHKHKPTEDPLYRPSQINLHNSKQPTEPTNWRFVSTGPSRVINDHLLGEQRCETGHDFVVWTKENLPTYQLAVVSDDHFQQITHVVRGNDLLQSAAWQEQLYSAMGWKSPTWLHVPLILGEDGKRLAKRHGDSRISTYREQGISPERIIGLIATWISPEHDRAPMTLETLLQTFNLDKLDSANIVFTKEEEAWLHE